MLLLSVVSPTLDPDANQFFLLTSLPAVACAIGVLVAVALVSIFIMATGKIAPDFSAPWPSSRVLYGSSVFNVDMDSANGTNQRSMAANHVLGGLVNTGNTCFLNSVIQSLSSLRCVLDFLFDSSASQFTVSNALAELISLLNTPQATSHTHSPASLLKALHSTRWTPDTEQQDAHEFLLSLLDAIRDERTKDIVTKHRARVAIDSAVHDISDHSQVLSIDTPLALPFDGLLSTQVLCVTCHEMQALRQLPFSSIELSLPSLQAPFFQQHDRVKLQDMLELYTASETLENVYCQRCSLEAARAHLDRLIDHAEQNKKSDSSSINQSNIITILDKRRVAILEALANPTVLDADFERLKPPRLVSTSKQRQVTIARAPKALAIHINRSEYDIRLGIARKKNASVEFPDKLDFSKYLTNFTNTECLGVDQTCYRLSSIVVHFGSHSFGHYISYRQVADNSWIRISDRDVRPATRDEVLAQSNVVMLFYEAYPVYDAKKLHELEESVLKMETDLPLYDIHENDVEDGPDLYFESSSSSSASSPVCEDSKENEFISSQIRRRRCSSNASSSTATIVGSPVSDADSVMVMVN
ncbi:hypothetical protein V1514DRAFT_345799 [Lipomyces japonicus]|uniref:uncharacterized protein n=1 Tax=Lipomyces japonicus TaxID=56871 RepID=UPI0034D00C7D